LLRKVNVIWRQNVLSDIAAVQVSGPDVDVETVRVLDVDRDVESLDVSSIDVALYAVSRCKTSNHIVGYLQAHPPGSALQ
jgi:hypothetical protein